MTRGLTARLTIALLALVAGCGGGDDGVSGSLDEQLGYLPEDAPLVLVATTDPESEQWKNVDRLIGKFPFGGQVKTQLKQSLSTSGVDYDKDVKPLLGGELVIGSPDARSLVDGAAQDSYVFAWATKDGGKARELLSKGTARESGEVDGETAYESSDGSVTIVKGDTMVGANDRPTLEAAIEREGGDGKLTEETLNGALEGLPEEPLFRVYGDAQKLLEADPSTATARGIKWVGGLRTFGMTGVAQGDGIAIDARVNTEGVGEQDLPLASGDEAPPVARDGVWAVGERNPAQLVKFIETAVSVADPEEFKRYDASKQGANKQLGIDMDKDVIGQFTGASSITGGLDGKVKGRSEVEDPAAMQKTLDAMVAGGRAGETRFEEVDGLVAATDSEGETLYFGMVGDVFVAAEDPADAKRMADVEPAPIEGAKGSLVGFADGEAIVKEILRRQGGAGALGGQFFTGAVGDVSGWVTTKPDGVTAHLKLKIE